MSELVELMASEGGVEFLRTTGVAWAASHEEAGADAEDARAKAERAIEGNIRLWSAGDDARGA